MYLIKHDLIVNGSGVGGGEFESKVIPSVGEYIELRTDESGVGAIGIWKVERVYHTPLSDRSDAYLHLSAEE